jgi:hypothetical protein
MKLRQFKMSLIVLFLTSLFLSACSGSVGSKQPKLAETNEASTLEFVGYITKIENQRALVVSSINKETIQRKEFYDAVWVSNLPSDIEVGQNIHVWFDGALAASYPGQGKASKVTISKIQKPEKAILSQEEVIRKALLNKDVSNVNILVIKDVFFDPNLAIWTIRYKSAIISDGSIEEHSIQVPDK